MDKITYRMTLDMASHVSQAVVAAKMDDTAREIRASLTVGGKPYEIEKDCYAVFTAVKPDGNALYNNCEIIGNEIVYGFTQQTCAAPGRMLCEFKLYDATDELITSPRFVILVEGEIYNGEVVTSKSEFTKLIEATAAAEQIAADLEEAKENGELNGPKGEKGDPGKDGAALIDDEAVRMDAAWSSEKTVNAVGVPASKTDLVVQVYPIADTNVKVRASLPSGYTHLKLYCTGLKLFNAIYNRTSGDTMDEGYISQVNGTTTNSNTSLRSRPVLAAHLVGKVVNIAGAYTGGASPGCAFYGPGQTFKSGTNKGTAIIPKDTFEMRFSILKEKISVNNVLDVNLIQLETGLPSDIQPFKEIVFEPTPGNIDIDQELLTGYNTIYAYAGSIEGGVFTPAQAVPVTVECVESPAGETWRLREVIARYHA